MIFRNRRNEPPEIRVGKLNLLVAENTGQDDKSHEVYSRSAQAPKPESQDPGNGGREESFGISEKNERKENQRDRHCGKEVCRQGMIEISLDLVRVQDELKGPGDKGRKKHDRGEDDEEGHKKHLEREVSKTQGQRNDRGAHNGSKPGRIKILNHVVQAHMILPLVSAAEAGAYFAPLPSPRLSLGPFS